MNFYRVWAVVGWVAVAVMAGLFIAEPSATAAPHVVARVDPSATPTPPPADPCALDIYGDHASGTGMAKLAGTAVTSSIIAHNRSASATPGIVVSVDFIILSTQSNPGPLPTVDWSSDGGSWHHAVEHFVKGSNGNQPQWASAKLAAPAFAAHGQHTLRLRVAFEKGTALGEYSASFMFATSACTQFPDQVGPLEFWDDAPLVTVHTAAHNPDPVTPRPTTAHTVGGTGGANPVRSPSSAPAPSPAPAPATPTVLPEPAPAKPGNPLAATVRTRAFRLDTGVAVAGLFVILSLAQFVRWRRYRAGA